MTTVVIDDSRVAEEFIAERRARGQDLYDEVWEGVYHVTPAGTGEHAHVQALVVALFVERCRDTGWFAAGPCNIGSRGRDDYRVPDAAIVAEPLRGQLYLPTALMVAEVRSPKDATYAKREFYARHDVREVLVVDPLAGEVEVWAGGDGLVQRQESEVLALPVRDLESRLLSS